MTHRPIRAAAALVLLAAVAAFAGCDRRSNETTSGTGATTSTPMPDAPASAASR